MKRFLPWLNLLGVLVLAGLCVVQWQRDRRMNLEVNRLEKVRQAHEQKIADQEKSAKGLMDDLAHFKEQFQETHRDSTEARAAAQKLERQNLQLSAEREQLKASVTNWAAAVAERDERLKLAGVQLRDLSARLNESVLKFNELASNHNGSIRRFNELATNYNSVVTQLNELRTTGKPGSAK